MFLKYVPPSPQGRASVLLCLFLVSTTMVSAAPAPFLTAIPSSVALTAANGLVISSAAGATLLAINPVGLAGGAVLGGKAIALKAFLAHQLANNEGK